MNETVSVGNINIFILILAAVGLPLMVGFLTEAGKDLYNHMRKKPDTNDFMERCRNMQDNCTARLEIIAMKKTDDFMLKRQDTLRDDRLPKIENKLVEMNTKLDLIMRGLKLMPEID